MPKQLYQLKDFSGGLNNLRDATDIADNEVAEAKNMSFTQQGAVGGAFNMKHASNNLVATYNTAAGDHIDHLEAGYGLGYFETDHYAADALTRSVALTAASNLEGFSFTNLVGSGKVYVTAKNDGVGSQKNNPTDGSAGSTTDDIDLHIWFPTGSEVIFSGSTSGSGGSATAITAGTMDGIYTVVGGNGGTFIILNRPPNNMILAGSGGVSPNASDILFLTGTMTAIPSGDKVLLLAHPDEHKIDVFSTSKNAWVTDVITLQGWLDDNQKSQVLYYKSEEAIRCCDTNRGTNGKIQWYGWISRQHFSYPGNEYSNEYSNYYVKDNNLDSPTYGQYEKDSGTALAYPTAGKGFNLKCFSSATDGLVEGKTYEFAQSFIYDGNQESLLSFYNKLDNSPISTLDTTLAATDLKQLSIQIGVTGPYDPRISGGRIYIRESGTDDEWNFLLDVDLTKGARISLSGDYTEWKSASSTTFYIGASATTYMAIDSISPLTYEVINGYPSNIFSNDIGGIGENWKDAVVSNSRVFVCNIRIKDENKGQHKMRGIAGEAELTEFKDRIMYSMPNRYDVFPSFNFIEAAKGDADHYMAIESHADRLLAFKRKSMDIINISSPSDTNWFLEDTKNYMGVETHVAVAKTQYGVVWVNKNGLFLYDGQTIKDLTENKIDDGTWYSFVTNSSGIIYDEVKSSIFVIKGFSSDGDAYMCDLKKGNFTYLIDFTFDAITNPVDTNFTSGTNTMVGTIEDDSGDKTRFYKLYRTPQAQANVEVQTKNFTLGDPNIMKKIYAIYITYQASSSLASDVFYSTDGGDSWETDASGPSATSSTVWQKGKWTIGTPPSASTIMVKVDTDATSNLVKINDIGIEYRPIHKRMA